MADTAIDQIKRTYGWMYTNDPGITAWEGIGPGGTPYEGAFTSMAHGWSTGVLPALTNELLGAAPTGAGFATWQVIPHPGTVTRASGQLPTPHGPLMVSWQVGGSGEGAERGDGVSFTLTVLVPEGTSGQVALPVEVGADGGGAGGREGAWFLVGAARPRRPHRGWTACGWRAVVRGRRWRWERGPIPSAFGALGGR